MIRRTTEQWQVLFDQHKVSGLTQTSYLSTDLRLCLPSQERGERYKFLMPDYKERKQWLAEHGLGVKGLKFLIN